MIVPTLSAPIYIHDKNVLSHNIELHVGIINIIRYNIIQVDSVISAITYNRKCRTTLILYTRGITNQI